MRSPIQLQYNSQLTSTNCLLISYDFMSYSIKSLCPNVSWKKSKECWCFSHKIPLKNHFNHHLWCSKSPSSIAKSPCSKSSITICLIVKSRFPPICITIHHHFCLFSHDFLPGSPAPPLPRSPERTGHSWRPRDHRNSPSSRLGRDRQKCWGTKNIENWLCSYNIFREEADFLCDIIVDTMGKYHWNMGYFSPMILVTMGKCGYINRFNNSNVRIYREWSPVEPPGFSHSNVHLQHMEFSVKTKDSTM